VNRFGFVVVVIAIVAAGIGADRARSRELGEGRTQMPHALQGQKPMLPPSAKMPLAEIRGDKNTPDAVVVRKDISDAALVCMEPPTGVVVCRQVGAFRKWILDTTQRGK
jgi:hypothetical protein